MSESLKLYVDQMFSVDVAEVLRHEGHDVVRASEIGQARADDFAGSLRDIGLQGRYPRGKKA